MSGITTHVLDISQGKPASGVPVTLEIEATAGWQTVGEGITSKYGRVSDLLAANSPIAPGVYRLIFDTAKYFDDQNTQGFYPQVTVVFKIENAAQHYHVPLLLSPFGYSTYRGS